MEKIIDYVQEQSAHDNKMCAKSAAKFLLLREPGQISQNNWDVLECSRSFLRDYGQAIFGISLP